MRHMVTRRKIDRIESIDGADFIETANIGGWQIVVGKDQFKVGDEVYYFEIDAFLPKDHPEFESFSKHGERTVEHPETGEQVTGHVLKTIRLKGQFSQGVALPVHRFKDLTEQEEIDAYFSELGVFKYERPIPSSMEGVWVGGYPEYLTRKTDSERVQNLTDEFLAGLDKSKWHATEKIDGTSSTFIKEGDKLRICSRNIEFDTEQMDEHNIYKRIAEKYDLETLLTDGQIIKGEIYGEGVQGNPLRIKGIDLAVFDWEGFEQLPQTLEKLRAPVYDIELPNTVQEAVVQVNKLKSIINPQKNAEGVVWWHEESEGFNELDGRSNFKAINNQYLLKNPDA